MPAAWKPVMMIAHSRRPRLLQQMVLDAPGVAHAAGGNDHQAAAHLVQRDRLLDVLHEAHVQAFRMGALPFDQFARVLVEQGGVPAG